MTDQPLVGIIMGSRSDWETMHHAADTLAALGVPHETKVVSAHRTPERLYDYAKSAKARGLKVVIAGAGGAAHLPGMAAAMTPLPVLGVPVESKALSGMDSLLSIVQMPGGIPVGTLAIGKAGAINAGLLAAAILATARRGAGHAACRMARASDRIRRRSTRMIIAPGSTIGIIGSGQLGRMLAIAAAELGYRSHVYAPEATGPASEVAACWTQGAYDDEARLRAFVEAVRRRDLRVRESARRGIHRDREAQALSPADRGAAPRAGSRTGEGFREPPRRSTRRPGPRSIRSTICAPRSPRSARPRS